MVPAGHIRLGPITKPTGIVKTYLSFTQGANAVLDTQSYDLIAKPLKSASGAFGSACQIQSPTIGKLQVIGTLVPTGTESAAPGEGPIQSIAGHKAVGWIFSKSGDGYTITADPDTVSDPTTEMTIYLVHDVARKTVTWKRTGGIIPVVPANSLWFFQKVPE